MNQWYNCAIKFEKLDQDGIVKITQDEVLVSAVNFTDAETQVTALKSDQVKGVFVITRLRKTPVEEIIPTENLDFWFKAKVLTTEIDEKSGKEKKYSRFIYISGLDFIDAVNELSKHLTKTYVQEYEIASVSVTKITDIIASA